MRDEDIVKSLKSQDALPKGAGLAFLGYLLIFVSFVWRLLAYFI
jgi:hypothetical protein